LGQHIVSIFKDLPVVMTYLPVLDNIPEEQRFQFMLLFSANFKCMIFKNLILELFWPWWWRGRYNATIKESNSPQPIHSL